VCAEEQAGMNDRGETKKASKEQVALLLATLVAWRASGIKEESQNLRARNRCDTGEQLVEF
jgi:hypothetical protein